MNEISRVIIFFTCSIHFAYLLLGYMNFSFEIVWQKFQRHFVDRNMLKLVRIVM